MAAPARKVYGWIRSWEDRAGIVADAIAARARRDGSQEIRDDAQEREGTSTATAQNSSGSNSETAYFTPQGPPALVEPGIDKEYVYPGLCGVIASPRALACALISTLGGFLVGYDQGVVSVVLGMGHFMSEFSNIESNTSGYGFWRGLLTAIIELGAFMGALVQGWITDKYSRKRSFMLAVVVFLVGNALQTSSQNFAMLFVARFIVGIGLGMLSMVTPLYISEISPAEIRGTLLVLEELAVVGGIIVAFWISFGTRHMNSEWSWRLPFMIQIAPALVLGLGAYLIPHSPRWLVAECRDEAALTVLGKLRQLPERDLKVQKEWTEIRADVICHQEISRELHPKLQGNSYLVKFKLELGLWADCFRLGCYKRTHIGMGLMFFQQLIGTKAVIYYSHTLFSGIGLKDELHLIMLGALYICQLVGVLSSLFTMDWYNRKPLLLWGSGLMCVCLIIIAALVGTFSSDWSSERGAGWACMAFFLLFNLVFGATWGPVPWVMPSEIFPSSLRAKGVALSTCCYWLTNFTVGLIIPSFIQSTAWGAFLFFTVFCLVSGFWAYFFVHETNNLALEEMDFVFMDAADIVAEEARRQRIRRDLDTSDTASPLHLPRGSV